MKFKVHVLRMGDDYQPVYKAAGFTTESVISILKVVGVAFGKPDYSGTVVKWCCSESKTFGPILFSPVIWSRDVAVVMTFGEDGETERRPIKFCPFCGAKAEIEIVQESRKVKRVRGMKVPETFKTIREESIEIERVKK